MNTKILVCCHKKSPLPQSDIYLPIQVGKAISTVDLGIQGDDTGDNISDMNGSYCELTGMYWAWRNLKNVDIIGLCHYRRFFDFHHQCRYLFPTTEFELSDFEHLDLSMPLSVVSKIERGEIVVPRHLTTLPLYLQYCRIHNGQDIRKLENVINNNSICERDAFVNIMYDNNKLHPFNMFIMRWEVFDDYCSWLFPLLKDVSKQIDISNYSSFQKRIYGFMAERLFNVYLKARNKNIIEYPVISFSDTKIINASGSYVNYLLREFGFNLINYILKFDH